MVVFEKNFVKQNFAHPVSDKEEIEKFPTDLSDVVLY